MQTEHCKRGVATSIDAPSCQYPLNAGYRKPRARMLILSMDALQSSPERTIMCGDKILDVLAAKNAGVRYVFWVDKLGGPDQWFDRYIYRKVEPLLKKIIAKNRYK